MHGPQISEVEADENEEGTASARSRHMRWDCKYLIPPKGAMVRLDQEWYYMAMRTMNVQIVRFFPRKNRKSVLAVCAIRLNGQIDRVIRTVRITIRTRTVAIPQ
jgi:hypothetical protein